MKFTPSVVAISVIPMLLASTTGCLADFTLCNHSDSQIDLSLGYFYKDGGWTSRGWMSLDSRSCRTILRGMPIRIYYVYAIDHQGRSWSAPKGQKNGWFCISKSSYVLHNSEYHDTDLKLHCEKDGHNPKQFILIDVGSNIDFTFSFELADKSEVPPSVETRPNPPLNPTPNTSPQSFPVPEMTNESGTACKRYPSLC